MPGDFSRSMSRTSVVSLDSPLCIQAPFRLDLSPAEPFSTEATGPQGKKGLNTEGTEVGAQRTQRPPHPGAMRMVVKRNGLQEKQFVRIRKQRTDKNRGSRVQRSDRDAKGAFCKKSLEDTRRAQFLLIPRHPRNRQFGFTSCVLHFGGANCSEALSGISKRTLSTCWPRLISMASEFAALLGGQ